MKCQTMSKSFFVALWSVLQPLVAMSNVRFGTIHYYDYDLNTGRDIFCCNVLVLLRILTLKLLLGTDPSICIKYLLNHT